VAGGARRTGYGGGVTSTVLAYIPSPPQGVWHLGPIPIRAYALCIIAGILIAVYWGDKRFVARGGQPGGRCSPHPRMDDDYCAGDC